MRLSRKRKLENGFVIVICFKSGREKEREREGERESIITCCPCFRTSIFYKEKSLFTLRLKLWHLKYIKKKKKIQSRFYSYYTEFWEWTKNTAHACPKLHIYLHNFYLYAFPIFLFGFCFQVNLTLRLPFLHFNLANVFNDIGCLPSNIYQLWFIELPEFLVHWPVIRFYRMISDFSQIEFS